jgi:thymidylate synthase ThyX
MNNLFETYIFLYQKYFDFLKNKYPEEKEIVLKTKVFDVIRLILPLSTLGQLALFGSGQAFEYLINRSLNHHLEEIKWLGERAKEELNKIIPAFLRRIEKEESEEYRKYLGERSERIKKCLKEMNMELTNPVNIDFSNVKLIEYDKDGEDKIITSLLYPELKEP